MKKKNNKGITLIALIITIIVLLILAGISISALSHTKLFEKAKNAKSISRYSNAKETINLKLMEIETECSNNNIDYTIKEIAKEIKKSDNITIEKYYNDNIASIKNGITENIINLSGLVVSVDEYNEFKFLLGKDGNIVGVTTQQITDTTDKKEFKDINQFEKETFGDKIDNEKEDQKDILAEYTSKDVQTAPKPIKLKNKSPTIIDANIINANYNENGYGIIFNGADTYATIDNNDLNLSYPITITTTVKWENGSNNLLFIDANSKIAIGTWNNELLVTVGSNYSYSYSLSDNFFKNDVNYITIEYTSNTNNILYVNGEKMEHSSYYGSWNRSESGIYLGRRASGSYFKGTLYSFNIYNKLLTEEEIINNYNTEKTNFENKNFKNGYSSNNLVLKYLCNAGENEEEQYLRTLKDNINNKYNFSLNDVEYNNTKNGLVFNGKSSYGILNNDSLDISFPTTISIIAQCNKYENNLLFTDKKSQIGIGFWNSDYIILRNDSYSAINYNIKNNFNSNDINYITAVYKNDIDDSTLYLNGNKINTFLTSDGWYKNENKTYIGRRNSGSYFDGTLYKIKIYKKALSEDEIIKEYQKDKTYYEKNN